MTKITLMLALAAGAMAFAPGSVAAEDVNCTEQYVKCLNDTWYYEGALQDMADLECSAEYAGCVARKWLTL